MWSGKNLYFGPLHPLGSIHIVCERQRLWLDCGCVGWSEPSLFHMSYIFMQISIQLGLVVLSLLGLTYFRCSNWVNTYSLPNLLSASKHINEHCNCKFIQECNVTDRPQVDILCRLKSKKWKWEKYIHTAPQNMLKLQKFIKWGKSMGYPHLRKPRVRSPLRLCTLTWGRSLDKCRKPVI